MQHAFLALGDSYTIGEGVAAAECWPMQLAARLRGEDVDVGEPRIVARTGWTTDELAAAMDAATFAPPYALVTLLVGVNNQYRGGSLDDYRDEFRALLQRAITLAGGDSSHVVALSIPDWGVTPFARSEARDAAAVAEKIDAFNQTARMEALAARARWVDVTAISRVARRRDDLVADGLHPSGRQYARWVEVILPAVRTVLGVT